MQKKTSINGGSAHHLPPTFPGQTLPEGIAAAPKRDCRTIPDKVHRCGKFKERFFYNVTSKSCESFHNYGCNGKMNSYRTLKACQHFCSEIDVCQMPPEKGDCDDKRQRWFYDPKNKDCRTFISGGCKGNLNNFLGPWSCG
ncbi:BPTI/Kunitz domain-containing protein-like [Ahaetulla prasina]|uniref:BPTI/Kunitz domain-containing protein-like n=1 Tax=Ahaetulla prasina TaxID=499056 RepID=UPI0026490F12|nr:BPTI/Kunitz domain-containing protein-like [Ahaetulla prasina]